MKKRRRIPPGAYSRHNGMEILYESSMFWHVLACMREVVVARKFLPKFNIWQKWIKIVLNYNKTPRNGPNDLTIYY